MASKYYYPRHPTDPTTMHIPAYPVKTLPRILMRLLLLAGMATTTAVGPLRAEDSKPTNIGSRLELFVDDALIDSLIDLDPAISTDAAIPRTLGTDSLDARDGIPSAEPSILVPDAIEKPRENFDIPVQIESIGLEPRMDSPKPVKGD